MYLRDVHTEHDIPSLRAFIRENPLGILTTGIERPPYPFLQSSHIPWILDVSDEASDAELGILRGHIARANPQAKAMMETLDDAGTAGTGKLEKDVMVLFNGPVHHYVTPKFYKETKPTTGKVVPTWNYAAVQVYGKATIYYQNDPVTSAYISRQVSDLSHMCETEIMRYETPWKVSDAPESYVELLKKAIIGIEIEIQDIGGKFKMSQEMKGGNKEGVIEGFAAFNSDAGTALAELVRDRGHRADEKNRQAGV